VNLRAVRERQGKSRQWVADQMAAREHRWYPSTGSRVEQGERRATWLEAEDLAEIFGVPVERFTWHPMEEAEAAEVAEALAGLHEASEEATVAVARLLAARATGRRQAAKSAGSKYRRAREAAAKLAADLEEVTVEAAVAAGEALWEQERRG
jgi:hypothetical protein